ncbi:MAG: DUF4435 domain-containing protein [Pyrinomonadaceae bacterium]
MADIPIRYISAEDPDEQQLHGDGPIVLIGPNGSGKTRHAAKMASWNDSEMIGAFRNIALGESIPMRRATEMEAELVNNRRNRLNNVWEYDSEIDQLFAKILAEDAEAAIGFREACPLEGSFAPIPTTLHKVISVWEKLFPGRHLQFKDHLPRVKSDTEEAGAYSARQMSDGERVALYLAARVLDSKKSAIFVDEPEVHFHSLLAVSFWSEMESLRRNCRFVYVTHDLPFALSRKNPTFLLAKPNVTPQLLDLTEGLPKEVSESLLAAASFSIHARRIVFCEGVDGSSLDKALYQAWFNDAVVVAADNCDKVLRCARVFSESNLIDGVEAIGLIDSDFWPKNFLDSLHDPIHVLPLHEVENLFCVPGVFKAICEYLQINDSDGRYHEFLTQAKTRFNAGSLNNIISMRFRARCKHQLTRQLNTVTVAEDLDTMKKNHVDVVDPAQWECPPKDVITEEAKRMTDALNGAPDDFLALFPGKTFFPDCARAIGVTPERYAELVCAALQQNRPNEMTALGERIEAELGAFLPPRR